MGALEVCRSDGSVVIQRDELVRWLAGKREREGLVDERYLPVVQASREWGVPLSTLRAAIARGRLRSIQSPFGKELILREDLLQYVASRRHLEAQAPGLLTITEASKRAGVCRARLTKACKNGELRYTVGANKLNILVYGIAVEELEAWLLRVAPPGEDLTISQTCRLYQISDDRVRGALKYGHLAARWVRIGGKQIKVLAPSDVERWIEAREYPSSRPEPG